MMLILTILSPIGLGLHCPNASALAAFKAAIQRGDITWHAFPFVSVIIPYCLNKLFISVCNRIQNQK